MENKKQKHHETGEGNTGPEYDNHISENFSPLVAIQNVPMQFVLVIFHYCCHCTGTTAGSSLTPFALFKLKPFLWLATQFYKRNWWCRIT